jgi:hypothetical protein
MDDHKTPNSRKGKHGTKKDQRMKSQNDNIFGSTKHIRLKERMMEQKNAFDSSCSSSYGKKNKNNNNK